MKKINSYKDFLSIKIELPREFAEYLGWEFQGMYEYLSNGEGVEEFLLPSYQTMIILEKESELQQVLRNSMEIEYIEKEYLGYITLSRIGIRNFEEIQLYYYVDSGENNQQ